MNKQLVIAIDGPAGAGKSTTAKEIALRLGYKYIDTGAMYRAVTLLALESGISMDSEEELTKLAEEAEINFAPLRPERNTVYLNGRDVTDEIRSTSVNENVSLVAKIAGVRKALVKKQREMAQSGGVVMDGRDIGTVVLPQADLKIFLTASLETRARRRMNELQRRGENVELEEIKKNLRIRDYMDSAREIAPLRKAEDAIEIDTTGMTVEDVVNKIINLTKEVKNE
ncbi:cytidylate kinase [Anoxybacter fermentans]|uniref:Cytidylate kinase n=1 Tax=Anoxybacter fermentans TaxID=1323375 RepID=A0A3Q9HPL7_9FIRM|nr:(d)CMP kinase [Anoxybacter fermentans]AZR72753.1 cytidylate kinase [Anoxybacter fermentans]